MCLWWKGRYRALNSAAVAAAVSAAMQHATINEEKTPSCTYSPGVHVPGPIQRAGKKTIFIWVFIKSSFAEAKDIESIPRVKGAKLK